MKHQTLWDFVLYKNTLNDDNRVEIIVAFGKLCNIMQEYDDNFNKILECVKGSDKHLRLLSNEAALDKESRQLRRKLNIHIHDPNPKERMAIHYFVKNNRVTS